MDTRELSFYYRLEKGQVQGTSRHGILLHTVRHKMYTIKPSVNKFVIKIEQTALIRSGQLNM